MALILTWVESLHQSQGETLELVGQELRRFPVLHDGQSAPSKDDVGEFTQAFFAAKGAAVTAGVLAQSTDEASMGRYLRRAVRHFLVDQARKTPEGAVRRKVEDLLRATPDFTQVPQGIPGASRWQLTGVSPPPFGGDSRSLLSAAYAVPHVKAVRWSGTRRTPLATDESLIRILRAVLETAGGSMEVAPLTAVLLQRFPAAAEYADAALDEQAFEKAVAPAANRPDVVLEVSESAREIYDQPSASQRALFPYLDKPMSEQAMVLGLGRSQAYVASTALKSLLAELVPDGETGASLIKEVLRLCVVLP